MPTTRTITLTGRDSADQVDLYVDGELFVPALTREERDDLWQQLARLDAAVDHGYDVRELTGLELPHAFAIVHDARVHVLSVWHDGQHVTDQRLDAREGAAGVQQLAADLAADVSRRVREGQL